MLGLGSLLAGLAALTWQTGRELADAAGRFSSRTVFWVCLVASLVVFGPAGTFNNIFWTVMILMVWRYAPVGWRAADWIARRFGRALPVMPEWLGSYDRVVGRRLRGWWRKHRLYDKRWKATMRGLRLSEINSFAHDDYPVLKSVVESPIGGVDIAKVKVLPWHTWEDYDPDALTKAFKARSCHVYDMPGTDYIRLEFARGNDPLADLVPLPVIPGTAKDVDLAAIPLGLTEKREAWTIAVRGEHILIAGIMGSGKSSVLHGLLRGMAPAIQGGTVEVWAVDPKRGMELGLASGLFAEYEYGDIERIARLLANAVKIMQARGDRLTELKLRDHTPTVEEPLIVLVIDEFLSLADLATGDKDTLKLIDSSLRLLLGQGRACGVVVIGATLDARVKEMPMRNLFSARIALALKTRAEADTILGPEAAKHGARCDRIPRSLRGVGFVWLEGWHGPLRVRAAYVDDDEVRRVAGVYARPERDQVDEPSSDAAVVPVKTLKPAPVVEEVTALMPVETVDMALADLDAATDWADVEASGPVVERSVTISVPDCPPLMNDKKVKRAGRKSPNGGWIPSGREQAEREWKTLFAKALAEVDIQGPLVKVGPLRAAMVFTHNDRYHRDLDNHWIAVKALGDAIQIAGLIPADTPEHWELSQSINPESRKGMGRSTVVTLTWDEPLAG